MIDFYSARMVLFIWVFSWVEAAVHQFQAWKYLFHGRDMIRAKAAAVRTACITHSSLPANSRIEGWRQTILFTCVRLRGMDAHSVNR